MLNKPWELDGSHYASGDEYEDPFINYIAYIAEGMKL